MPKFLTIVNRTLIVCYIVVVLPLMVGLMAGKSWPVIASTPWARFIQTERQNVRIQSKMMTLNLYMPASFAGLYELMGGSRQLSPWEIAEYTHYFEQVAQVLPAPYSADAFAMTGFCYYHQGKIADAQAAYVKALVGNPAWFWTYYNLGLLAVQQHNYAEAAEILTKAMALKPETALAVLSSSKIYTDILKNQPQGFSIPAELQKVYDDALRLLVISLYELKQFKEVREVAGAAIARQSEAAGVFYYFAGVASLQLADYQKALMFLEQSIAADPLRTMAYEPLAVLFKTMGDDNSARHVEQRKAIAQTSNVLTSTDNAYRAEDLQPRFF